LQAIEVVHPVLRETSHALPQHDKTSSRRLGLASAASLAVAPATAGSQSSNSSSNCSNGRCSRVDTLVIEDGRGRTRGWQRVERWDERRDRIRRPYRDRDD
jgi:hypothetical protein